MTEQAQPVGTVLVVDDEQDIRDSVEHALEVHLPTIAVRTAANGQDALRILQGEPVSVIVTDYRMPDMDGLEFLRRAASVQPGAARIVITAYPNLELALKAINEFHPDRFLVKPFSVEEIVDAVRTLLVEGSGPHLDAAAAREITAIRLSLRKATDRDREVPPRGNTG